MNHGEYTSLGYRAATVERSSGRSLPVGGSADLHSRFDLDLLRRIGQGFDRDNAIAQGLTNRAAENILGAGFKLEASTGDKKLNKRLEAWWTEWSEDPEIRGIFSFADLEDLTLKHLMTDGDVAYVKTTAGKLQAIEAERIVGLRRTKGERTENGVELDAVGRPLAFWVANYTPYGVVSRNTARRIPAEAVFFVAHRRRLSQTRGIPVQVPSFPMVHRINDVCDSEAIAWQLLSRFALSCSRDMGPQRAYIESELDAGIAPRTNQPPNLDVRLQDVGEGVIFHAPNDGRSKLSAIPRDLPGANFSDSVRMFLRLIGLPFGLPLELILLDWSQTNYSSARASLEQSHRNFARWQKILIRQFHRPVYLWALEQAVRAGLFPERADLTKHVWIAPKFPWLDVLKESMAWGNALDRGFSTQTEILATRGTDREDHNAQRKLEIEEAIEIAEDINKQHPDAKVPWQIFAGLEKPATTAQVAAADNDSNIPPSGKSSKKPSSKDDDDENEDPEEDD